MKEMNTNQVVNLVLVKEVEIANKIHNTVNELLRLGYDSERGKALVPDLVNSINYSLEDLERIINRE